MGVCMYVCVHVCVCARVCSCVCAGVCAGAFAPARGAWGVVLVENWENEQVVQSQSSDALATDSGDCPPGPGIGLPWRASGSTAYE